jgi:hypothetical protein
MTDRKGDGQRHDSVLPRFADAVLADHLPLRPIGVS